MSDDPRRESRRRGHIQVEPLESRASERGHGVRFTGLISGGGHQHIG